ncbi:DUF7848 domain-containing protein, partial [Streptomyces alkaliphilus]|uniref:DUF7848 domain-containing protein n=1 Tax=Streptomyces alkaliphilus TaxID=1472722 RepID=UPI0018874BC0
GETGEAGKIGEAGTSDCCSRSPGYSIEPDAGPDAEPLLFSARCAVCGLSGPAGPDAGATSRWMLAHLRSRPGHVSFREIITRPYRAVPHECR